MSDLLQTARLSLEPHRIEDFEESFSMWSDPRVTRYIGGRPSNREETWARLLRYIGHWQALGFGYWVVRERDGGQFVGEVGFADFKREIEPRLDGALEMGWALAWACHGRGYATEAIAAALAWADDMRPMQPAVCIIAPENTASLKLADRFDFQAAELTDYKGQPTQIFRRPVHAR